MDLFLRRDLLEIAKYLGTKNIRKLAHSFGAFLRIFQNGNDPLAWTRLDFLRLVARLPPEGQNCFCRPYLKSVIDKL